MVGVVSMVQACLKAEYASKHRAKSGRGQGATRSTENGGLLAATRHVAQAGYFAIYMTHPYDQLSDAR